MAATIDRGLAWTRKNNPDRDTDFVPPPAASISVCGLSRRQAAHGVGNVTFLGSLVFRPDLFCTDPLSPDQLQSGAGSSSVWPKRLYRLELPADRVLFPSPDKELRQPGRADPVASLRPNSKRRRRLQ